MEKKLFFIGMILAGMCLHACQTGESKTVNPKAVQLETLFGYLAENGMYNGSVAVRDSGEVIFKAAYGPGNFERNTVFEPASQTEIASVSKQFTATAIMLLQEDGQLDVADDINRYFEPALPFEGITIKHLLTHTSGVPNYEKYFRENWDEEELVYNRQIMDYIYEENPPVQFEPGEKYEYSNLGYVLLAEIVANVSGKPLDDFLWERVFEPFGMEQTGFFDRAKIFEMENYAPGMLWDMMQHAFVRPETVEGYEFVWYLSGRLGPGRLTSTVDDLLKWDSLLHTGSVLSEESLALMYTPHVEVPNQSDGAHYGFGWRLPAESTLGPEAEHGGAWPGNYTHIKRYPRSRSAYILLNNTYTPYMKRIRDAVDAILKGNEFSLPKPLLHDFLARNVHDPDFDRQAWLDSVGDFSDFEVNEKAWERLLTKSRQSADSSVVSFFDQVNARFMSDER